MSVWTLGVLLYSILFDQVPFKHENEITDGKVEWHMSAPGSKVEGPSLRTSMVRTLWRICGPGGAGGTERWRANHYVQPEEAPVGGI